MHPFLQTYLQLLCLLAVIIVTWTLLGDSEAPFLEFLRHLFVFLTLGTLAVALIIQFT